MPAFLPRLSFIEAPGAFEVAECVEEGGVVAVVVEDGGAVVEALVETADETITEESRGSCYVPQLTQVMTQHQKQIVLTPFSA